MSEDPKSLLRQHSARLIWPSENYVLNIWKDGERWQDGEFCPGQVNERGEFMQFDAMYNIENLVYQALGIQGDEPTPEQEASIEQGMAAYESAIFNAIEKGITSGSTSGIAGHFNWQLMYDPLQDGQAEQRQIEKISLDRFQPVVPGKAYGTRITPKTDRSQWRSFGGNIDPMAEALVAAILDDSEDPKSVFKLMQGPEPIFLIKVSVFNRPQRTWRDVGSFVINAETGKVTQRQWAPYFVNRPTPEDLKGIVASLRKHGTAMAGHYPLTDPWPGRFHWEAEYAGDLSRHRPVLVVEGPGWTVRGPLMKSTDEASSGYYIWRFDKLTPEQHEILKRFGEFIYLAMNEGNEFRGELDDEEDPDADPISIRWRVQGNPEFAIEGSWENSDWSGLAGPLP